MWMVEGLWTHTLTSTTGLWKQSNLVVGRYFPMFLPSSCRVAVAQSHMARQHSPPSLPPVQRKTTKWMMFSILQHQMWKKTWHVAMQSVFFSGVRRLIRTMFVVATVVFGKLEKTPCLEATSPSLNPGILMGISTLTIGLMTIADRPTGIDTRQFLEFWHSDFEKQSSCLEHPQT